MKLTTNYGLYLEEDSTARFQVWRKMMSGETDSNMVKIDTVLGDKADHSLPVSATLLGNAWTGIDSPFTQEIDVPGLGELQNGNISVAQNATFEQREAARNAMLAVIGQADGKLVIAADGEMPEIDIPVVIILLD